jgi:hypothetical protein
VSVAARILVAVKAEPLPLVRAALAGYQLVSVSSIEHAEQLLVENAEAIDLFLIGILFDDSRAMELIRMIRLDINNHATPILMVRLMPSQHEEMLRHVMETMIALGTISDYLEADYQDPVIAKQLREAAEGCLRFDKRLRHDDGPTV